MNDRTDETPYDLFARTRQFAVRCRALVRALPQTQTHAEDGRQLIRSSGSVGANYIESREALGKKDAMMRLRICRKEARESAYWLSLLEVKNDESLERSCQQLEKEAKELTYILTTILQRLDS